MYDMYPEWGPANHEPENPAATRPSRPRSTCGTTAASAPTTTSLAPHDDAPRLDLGTLRSPSSPATASVPR